MGDAKLSPSGIIELINSRIIDPDVALIRYDDTGYQVQQGCLAGTAGADDSNFFMLLNRKFGYLQREISGGIRKR